MRRHFSSSGQHRGPPTAASATSAFLSFLVHCFTASFCLLCLNVYSAVQGEVPVGQTPEIPWDDIPFFPGYNSSIPFGCNGNAQCGGVDYPSAFIWAPHWVHGFSVINATEVLTRCPQDTHARAACLGTLTEADRFHKQIMIMDSFIAPDGIYGNGMFMAEMAAAAFRNKQALDTKCVIQHGRTIFEVMVQWTHTHARGTNKFMFHCPVRFPIPLSHVTVELRGPALTVEQMAPRIPPTGVADAKWWSWPRRMPGKAQPRAAAYKKKHRDAHPNSIAMSPVRIGACAGNLFNVDTRTLIQWIEYHRLIGVSVFVMYPIFPNKEMWSELVAAYYDDPEITLIVVAFSQVLKFAGVGHFQQHVASMHCPNVLRGLADHILLIDPDEMIVNTDAHPRASTHPREWVTLPNDVLSWEKELLPNERMYAIFRPLNFFGTCVPDRVEPVQGYDIMDTTPVRFAIEYLRLRCNNPLWWYDDDKTATKPTKPWNTWPEATRTSLCGNNLKMMVDARRPYVMQSTHELRNGEGIGLRPLGPPGWLFHHYRNVTSIWHCGFMSTGAGGTHTQAYPGGDSYETLEVHCFPGTARRRKTEQAGISLVEHQCRKTKDRAMYGFIPFMKENVQNNPAVLRLWQKVHADEKAGRLGH